MQKRIVSLLLVLLLCTGLAACQKSAEDIPFGSDKSLPLANGTLSSTTFSGVTLSGDPTALKVGVILAGDATLPYMKSHLDGLRAAAALLGVPEGNIIIRANVPESEACFTAAIELCEAGCDLVVSTARDHQDYMRRAATQHQTVYFVAMAGNNAARAGLENFSNAFNKIHEARYISGVVAGMKIKELKEKGKLTDKNYLDGKVKVGYVAAVNSPEVISGYTAFLQGIRSCFADVTLQVKVIDSWTDIEAEKNAANALINEGCVLLGHHTFGDGVPVAVQAEKNKGSEVYCVGHGADMSAVAPTAALTSVVHNFAVYYAFAMATAANGTALPSDWAAGLDKGAVAISAFSSTIGEGTVAKVIEAENALRAGSLAVFDTAKFTVDGKTITFAYLTDSNGNGVPDIDNAIANGAYHEAFFRSDPSFYLKVDGVTVE